MDILALLGIEFCADADDCIADLLRTLAKMSIDPIGTAEVDLTDVVEYREVGETQEEMSARMALRRAQLAADGENARNDNFTAHSAKTPTSWQKPFQTELLDSASTLPLWQLVPEAVTVSTGAAVGDSVRYRFVDEDEEAFVTLVPYESNPNLGMINVDTPVGRALLGRADGDECEVMLPTGKRRIRVIKVEKRSTSELTFRCADAIGESRVESQGRRQRLIGLTSGREEEKKGSVNKS